MFRVTRQVQEWVGAFGHGYTDRNAILVDEMEAFYKGRFGLTRTEINRRFLSDMDPSMRILEVGCNVGNQLLCLQRMGFHNLYGIEIQDYAVELSRSRCPGINIIVGSAFDIPFKDGFFDMVFTSGVLIHIGPSELPDALREAHRCANRYIWGMEYYADSPTELSYRGHSELLWKDNFAKRYLDLFPDLRLLKEECFNDLNNDNKDTMFLLSKPR
ncbi:MAG: methyltransferase domain-containing protein [Chloroflexi bacterium]|nr:methyltransferase domain-containing protein [Chloroflexota bacterium]